MLFFLIKTKGRKRCYYSYTYMRTPFKLAVWTLVQREIQETILLLFHKTLGKGYVLLKTDGRP